MSNNSTRISIEIVARDNNSLENELDVLTSSFNKVDTINIPDLMRFELRSWDACSAAKLAIPHCIPHLRAIDFDLINHPDNIAAAVADMDELLIVTGDKPQDLGRSIYPTTSCQLIQYIKQHWPEKKVFAALDPYRQSFSQELLYCQQKISSGADGFFTQPFFDIRLMSLYAEIMPKTIIYWGVSPVLGERSKAYWQTRNNAIFPNDFEPSMQWNREFARQALAFVRSRGQNIYFMPIRADLKEYLQGII
ncbi:methylenetetrahydrofolate reductase (NADPH) [Sinobacterium caligoides]|uniref:Methylenetetrahydrofolate reductase n=1 Tax=Sinobacterium caligoides TaxID=933926 RepID=A0A3N2DYQ3_9GAMM|nr:methylenetetrahydrofolate reductase [Sinobacterium caligoides]ROS04802.1 methylenetetrahydrofolate reductase (NADPH) [Sinobacterium caligoides]